MPITKKPEQPDKCRKGHYYFENARSGFYSILKYLDLKPGEMLLLPSYIGWSSREGSGIFDPVIASNVKYQFYPLKKDLSIDFPELSKLLENPVKVVLLVNYFGFPDAQYTRICHILKSKGIIIIEDEAHSLFTHFIGGASGHLSDFSIFSLHKMLPYHDGGMVLSQHDEESYRSFYQNNYEAEPHLKGIFLYDFNSISRIRRQNYLFLQKKLNGMNQDICLIYNKLPAEIVPQTFPVLIESDRRDDLYFGLNQKGFGAVSLYHSLIKEIHADKFPDAHYLAGKILNLPVHQDVSPAQLEEMIEETKRILS